MAAPRATVWDLQPHTRAKHEILKRYMQAWTPILTRGGHKEVLYIDGFAGPGKYSGGEPGSPVIALRTALEYREHIDSDVYFYFVEKDLRRAEVLEKVVAEIERPSNFRVKVVGGMAFAEAFEDLRRRYHRFRGTLPPTFAFIDPFGWSGVPFSVVREIMSYRSCEVMVTFMYEEINRFIGHPDQEANFDRFFGTKGWRKGINTRNSRERNRFLHDLYMKQLRERAGAAHVRSFEMRNEHDVTDYFLFHATNSIRGLQKMKEAMWKVDESGGFTFSDATDPNQLVLFEKKPRFDVLRRQILERFAGRTVTVGEIEHFVLTETAFRETHYKRWVLRDLECSEPQRLVVVDAPPKRRRGTYGNKSLRLRFHPVASSTSIR